MYTPMRTIFRARRLLLACLAAAGLAACHDHPLESPPPAGDAQLALNASVAGTGIQTLVVTVSAADIPAPLVFNIAARDGVASGTLRLPAGTARRVVLEAFDAAGEATYEGSATVDVRPGVNPTLSIPLVPRDGRLPVTVLFTSFTIRIEGGEQMLWPEEERRLAAVLVFDGRAVPAAVEWATTDPGKLRVEPDGRITALRPGEVRVVATYEGVVASIPVTVREGLSPERILYLANHLVDGTERPAIFSVRSDGSAPAFLALSRALDWQLAPSPDRRTLLIPHYHAGGIDLVLMNYDGTGWTNITNAAWRRHWSAAWSPDGQRIAFQMTVDGERGVHIMNRDGSGAVRVPGVDGGFVSWAPDGEKLVSNDTAGVFTVNLDGSGKRYLANGSRAKWSPDGSVIAFSAPSGEPTRKDHMDIFLIRPDGTELRRLTWNVDPWDFSFSPDGTRIAFLRGVGAERRLHVVGTDGTSERVLDVPTGSNGIRHMWWSGS
jgi:hypothetical protein